MMPMPAHPGATFALWLAIAAIPSAPSLAQDEARALSASFRKAAKKVLPAVVTVRGLGGVPPIAATSGGLYPGRDAVPDAGGSGVVVDAAKGLILTNDHVVPDAPRIVVILPDGRQRTAKEVRRDPRSDLALLVIDPDGLGLAQADWGDSDALDLADWTLAVGQPFGLSGTVTAGIVSGARRGFGPVGYDDLIQTSAAINPGSSGGPLIDLDGRVVGINVAIKTLTGGYEGVGFAVPAARAKRVAADLAEFGRVRRAYLGVGTEPLESDVLARLGGQPGVVVASIAIGSPAEAAGLKVGDVILKVGDRAANSPGAVRLAVEFAPIGEPLSLSVLRDGKNAVLASKPTAAPDEPKPGERERRGFRSR
jgi:serine protease Do